ncbi:cell division FtsA domain-containing protein [Inconstantimicrobium mannanitabidum]|uniref:Cell division protein FtsA n=1 Tax=Inconstantimicrobium mannanitabidum TaxID=1604901 RepID=A0ACB5RC04_9CLOT|nr:cell division FtsA domain-containing protein [Clostridium sp. TW13]GKX66606.1 cell division protein FtsA [Clostridium sp. TW13]
MQQYIVGMDIGSQNICVTLAKMNGENIEFLNENIFVSDGVAKGKIVDVNKLSLTIQNVMHSMQIQYNDNIRWYIGIGNSNVRSEHLTAQVFIKNSYDIITEQEIIETIQKSSSRILKDNEELLYFNVDEYVLNGVARYEMPLGASGESLEIKFTCFIARKDYINNLKNTFSLCGIDFITIYLNCFELKNVVINEKTRDKSLMILDVGAQTTDFMFFRNNVVDSFGVIPLGGDAITNDLSICTEIEKSKAEEIKILHSSAYEKYYRSYKIGTVKDDILEIDIKLFYEVIRARLEELAMIIAEKIKNSGYYNNLQVVYVFGEGIINFEGIHILLEDILKKKVVIVSKEQLNLQSASVINSVCIAKSACDRFKLEYRAKDKITVQHKTENTKTNEKKVGFINNLKKILDDIF